ncbi:MAG: protein-glutamate O-methyltransferase CheR, partial [Candidatus Hydrothermarchaeota archaeon]
YSIAILIREYLKKKNNNFFIRIIATDIDEEMLEKGRKGWYSDEEMKGEIKKYLNYFEKENGGYRVKPEIRNLVIFKKHDLLSDKMPSCIDMIFCRNVAIYFTRETKEKLYLDFYNALNKGGYFVTGKTEMLIGEARQLFVPVNNSERIYLKL